MQLIVQAGTEPGKTYDLNPGSKVTIGRQSSNQIVVPDEQVSRKHAEVVPSPGGALLTDLGSSNGTFVNGNRITNPLTLKAGDLVQVGTTVLKLLDNDQEKTLFQVPNLPASDATVPVLDYKAINAARSSAQANPTPEIYNPNSDLTPVQPFSQPAPDAVPYAAPVEFNSPASQRPEINPAAPAGSFGSGSLENPPDYRGQQSAPYNQGAVYGQDQNAPLSGQPNYNQPPQTPYGQTPAAGGYGQFGGYNQEQPAQPYNQPGYVQPQPGYVQPQPGYVQPQPVAVRRNNRTLLLVGAFAIIALVILGLLYFVNSGSKAGDLPAPTNATRVELNSTDQNNLAQNYKNTQYSFYTSKDSVNTLAAYYKDQMAKKGYKLDDRSVTSDTLNQLVFTNGDKAAIALLVNLDKNTIDALTKSASSLSGKLNQGDTLVGLSEGKITDLK